MLHCSKVVPYCFTFLVGATILSYLLACWPACIQSTQLAYLKKCVREKTVNKIATLIMLALCFRLFAPLQQFVGNGMQCRTNGHFLFRHGLPLGFGSGNLGQ
ncbi:hypothetical protein BX070DRAFT_64350 [Coemansia spiralis]|nr:hypothetical protein BX070DRAFT_64350 [Coemansia spiralis]